MFKYSRGSSKRKPLVIYEPHWPYYFRQNTGVVELINDFYFSM